MNGMRAMVPLGLAVAIALITFAYRRLRTPHRLDVGAVSEGWLAEQRADSYDPGR